MVQSLLDAKEGVYGYLIKLKLFYQIRIITITFALVDTILLCTLLGLSITSMVGMIEHH